MSTSVVSAPLARPTLIQFRLNTLFLLMLWVGIVSLALKFPNRAATGLVSMTTLLLMLLTTLLIVYRIGRKRAAVVGFLVFCGGYLMHTQGYFWPFFPTGITSEALGSLATVVHGTNISDEGINWSAGLGLSGQSRRIDFISICHHSIGIVLGVIGSLLAQGLYATRAPAAGDPAS